MADPKRTRPDEQAEPGTGTAIVEERLKVVAGLYAAGGAKPDFSSIWQDEDFLKLDETAQADLKARYAADQTEPETFEETRPENEPAPEPRQPEKRENVERTRQRPNKWVFQNYLLKPDRETGGFLIFETKQRLNEQTGQPEITRHPQRTAIRLPEALAAQITSGEVSPEEMLAYCEKLRRSLDGKENEGGLRLHFDPQRSQDDAPDVWLPKWKYGRKEISGSKSQLVPQYQMINIGEEPWIEKKSRSADPDILPPNLNQIANDYWREGGRQYWRENQTWKDWYGKALQRKREDIITAELNRGGFGVAAAAETDRPATERQEKAAPKILVPAPEREEQAEPPIPAPTLKAETAPVEHRDKPPRPPRIENAPTQPAKVEKKESARPLEASQVARDASAFIRHLRLAYEPLYANSPDRSGLATRLVDATLTLLEEQYINRGQLRPKTRLDRENDGEYRTLVARLVSFGSRHPRLERFQEAKIVPLDDNRVVFELDNSGTEALARTFIHSIRELVADTLEQRGMEASGIETEAEEIDADAKEEAVKVMVKVLNKAKDPADAIIGFDAVKGLLNINDHRKLGEKILLLYSAKKKPSDLAQKAQK
ncbi:MAG: hypothetical protein WCT10_01755 [Patescibacteria group bacterium]|jgi:hypothetical protein